LLPLVAIAENAGEDGAIIFGKMLEGDEYDSGFDAQTGEFQGHGRRRYHRPDERDAIRIGARSFRRLAEEMVAERQEKSPAGNGSYNVTSY
jgi:chaperonin GroEL